MKALMARQRFLQLQSGHILDLSQVEVVSPVYGDPQFRRFEVRFRSGYEFDIYTNRVGMPGPMNRNDFIEQLLARATVTTSGEGE